MPEKKGLFARLFSGLSKTRGNLTEKVDEITREDRKIDEDFYEELEDALLLADCGVKATTVILDELREQVKKQNLRYAGQARQALMDIITAQMDIPRPPLRWPLVMLMVGVNGVGKTGRYITWFGDMNPDRAARGQDLIYSLSRKLYAE